MREMLRNTNVFNASRIFPREKRRRRKWAVFGLEIRCSIQLSYRRFSGRESSATGGAPQRARRSRTRHYAMSGLVGPDFRGARFRRASVAPCQPFGVSGGKRRPEASETSGPIGGTGATPSVSLRRGADRKTHGECVERSTFPRRVGERDGERRPSWEPGAFRQRIHRRGGRDRIGAPPPRLLAPTGLPGVAGASDASMIAYYSVFWTMNQTIDDQTSNDNYKTSLLGFLVHLLE